VLVRTLVDPIDAKDLIEVHALQDAIKVIQKSPGRFEVPQWDQVTRKKVHDALLVLGDTLPDARRMYGTKDQVDPVRHLIGRAVAWGGTPEKDAFYLNLPTSQNDGAAMHRLNVKDVPVDGFRSASVDNTEGYFHANASNPSSLNHTT